MREWEKAQEEVRLCDERVHVAVHFEAALQTARFSDIGVVHPLGEPAIR
jgi:hypothetical protein